MRVFTDPDLHVTLGFLGSVQESDARKAWDLVGAFRSFRRVVGSFSGVKPLGNPRKPSALSAMVEAGREPLIEMIADSPARTAIVPAQDLLGLGEEARMNTPGTTEGNWRWRLHPGQIGAEALDRELAAVVGAERFLAEIKIVAGLNHPHILMLIDSGEADGLLYYVMPFVEGESLAGRLERDRQLPLEEALRITAEGATADECYRAMEPTVATIVDVAGLVLLAVLNLVIFWYSLRWIGITGSRMISVLQVPRWTAQIAIPIGTGTSAIFCLIKLWLGLRGEDELGVPWMQDD